MSNEVADNKYGLLDTKLVTFLKECEIKYFREDKPVPFCGLQIYPIKVRDFETFSNCTICFTLNKNEDPKGVAMSHLEYLLSKLQIAEDNEGVMWSYRLQRALELVFHVTNGLKCPHCGKIITYDDPIYVNFIKQIQQLSEEDIAKGITPSLICPECGGKEFEEMIKIVADPETKKRALQVDGHMITKQDFNQLRQIVLYQNFSDYADDSWVDPDVKKDHDERVRLEQLKNDMHASIEKKVICLSITTNYKVSEIYDMTIRQFTLALATVDDLINYKIMKQAVMSGFVTLPKDKTIEHWIYKPNKDMYGDSYKSTDQITESVSNL